jgi:hypothetical protein
VRDAPAHALLLGGVLPGPDADKENDPQEANDGPCAPRPPANINEREHNPPSIREELKD